MVYISVGVFVTVFVHVVATVVEVAPVSLCVYAYVRVHSREYCASSRLSSVSRVVPVSVCEKYAYTDASDCAASSPPPAAE